MEKRLNKKVDNYFTAFKDNIRNKACETGLNKNDDVIHLLQYIYDYERLNFDQFDFQKRKRVKNFVPIFDRCCAKRAAGEQCTRRKKEGCEYCGTHTKGTPHGIIDLQNEVKTTTQKIEVWVQDIKGIHYYIDKNGNVYQPEDILGNKPNPKIIAKYVNDSEKYSIPELNV